MSSSTGSNAPSSAEQLRRDLATLDLPSREELTALLENAVNEEQLNTIRSFISAAFVVTALPVLKYMRATSRAVRHCLRCHCAFTERENFANACRVPHVFDTKEITVQRDYQHFMLWRAECCGDVGLEEDMDNPREFLDLEELEPCYEGFHTDDPEDVWDEYNDISIVTCKLDKNGECVEWRNYDPDEPLLREDLGKRAKMLSGTS